MRCRFAQRFGTGRDVESDGPIRSDSVRHAFNSPFRPFILASTSVGQEGLDFHPYSHVVIHWNLPSNPVDLEQREGRVHRYKGHAIRRNIAKQFGLKSLTETTTGDPWEHLFEDAARLREPGSSELTPYWLFEPEDGHAIERRLMILPLSREVEKYERLKRMLAVYRLAFGQPRQEDLLAHLTASNVPVERMNLRPRS